MLVTTDLAARGLDELDVQHVVQFDFAKSAADYVHRCGRTARAGKRGEVTSLVTKSDSTLVQAVREAQRKGGDIVAAGDKKQLEARKAAQHEQRKRDKDAAAEEREALKRRPRGARGRVARSRDGGRGGAGPRARGRGAPGRNRNGNTPPGSSAPRGRARR